MPASRMRMRPWLEMQINSNQIPGLEWVNKEEMIFQIPWKHAARHGWEMEKDACLFQKWAVHTGRYKAGEKAPDPKTWKANFRCAMNSLPDIEEVKDKSVNKGCSAVRVYRMLPASMKIERKERKSRPSKESKKRNIKPDYDENSLEDRLCAMRSNSLDDHSCYTDHSYSEQDLDIHNTTIATGILECSSSSLAGLGGDMQISLVDSTNDLYPFEVSPSSSPSSAATEEDEDEGPIADDFIQMFERTDWHQANVDGKGYLSNEAGTHFTDLSSRDLPSELEKMSGEIEFRLSTDMKTGLDLVSWLDPNYTSYLPNLSAISCTF